MPGPVAAVRVLTRLLVGALLVGCGSRAPERPSVLLVVFDPLRADAVRRTARSRARRRTWMRSLRRACGTARRRTGAVDHAPHVTLFTGMGVEQHRSACPSRSPPAGSYHAGGAAARRRLRHGRVRRESDRRRTVRHAPGLRPLPRPYARAGDRRASSNRAARGSMSSARLEELGRRARTTTRPFFAFVNLFEPHEPFRPRAENRFFHPARPRGRRVRPPTSCRRASATALPRRRSWRSCTVSISGRRRRRRHMGALHAGARRRRPQSTRSPS